MKRLAWLLVICGLLGNMRVTAQEHEAPILFSSKGDIWSWSPQANGAPVRRTNWGYNGAPLLSPDGERIAYFSAPQIFIDAIPLNPDRMGVRVPVNIWVLEIATNQANRIALQPENIRMDEQGVIFNGIERGALVWSPDGAKLAWLEAPMDEAAYALSIYDLDTGMTTMPVTGLDAEQCMEGMPRLDLLYGRDALILYGDIVTDEGEGCRTTFYVYDFQGHLLNTMVIPEEERPSYLRFAVLIDYDGRDVLALLNREWRWRFYDPLNGESLAIQGRPERYSLLAPETSIRLVTEPGPDRGINPTQWTVHALTPDGTELLSSPPGDFGWLLSRVSLAPDGQSLIYRFGYSHAVLYLWRAGRSVEVLPDIDLFSLVWGPMGWRIGANAD